ncbi:pre-mRNA-splicing factor cwf23 [Cocos nucifera]|uniref:Pre-mRNA-splicing factor cwf23 n=1 Tax=Cocos nucifera TaxID=13894 RepID=A0A8K0MTK0_COCNU|nr:pre-mRNA-splicing factor cwf23 [Cocos nucifera]
MAEELDSKALLVRDICAISSIFTFCTHRRRSPRKPAFVDWYLILGIDEDSEVDVIRRRYRQLALQLHPDKNKHPKAEVAFKLVSEAYACLSDKIRRRDFNSDRRDSYCKECNQKSDTNSSKERNGHHDRRRTKSKRILQALKEVQNRFREECRVIESCLRANAAFQRDFPLFDPSDYLLFPEYPHHRDRLNKNPQDIWYNHASEVQNSKRRGGRCESPIYQARPENRPNRTKNSSFRY